MQEVLSVDSAHSVLKNKQTKKKKTKNKNKKTTKPINSGDSFQQYHQSF